MKSSKNQNSEEDARGSGIRKLIGMLAVAAVVAAIVGELRKPKESRTWHGKVAGFIPYDFRFPTKARIKNRVANPGGGILSPQVFGVGWTVNVGGVISKLRKASKAMSSARA